MVLHRAVDVEEQNKHGAWDAVGTLVVTRRTDCDVHAAIPIQITERSNRVSEELAIGKPKVDC